MPPRLRTIFGIVCVLMIGSTARAGIVGPDVIVTDLQNAARWTTADGITAYSVGTTSCNVGDQSLLWQPSTNLHPVIAQNMYRLKNGRFEQIGMSWLKHGFAAIDGDECGECQITNNDSILGVGCSDPYGAGLNGNQARLGPRSQVNPFTGAFTYPFTAPAATTMLHRRLQVHNADLAPDTNEGAQYFVEGQYVTPDDALAGNLHNNVSHRAASFLEQPSGSEVYFITLEGDTQIGDPAILAWPVNDAGVTLRTMDIPGDGRLILGVKVTDLGDGFWRYEYAIYNQNADRAVGSFSVPIHPQTAVRTTGFHDVDSHSGEPYAGTDWSVTVGGGAVTWVTETFGTNPNANAIRWGTLYNFRFEANIGPVADANLTVGLFKPGAPAVINPAPPAMGDFGPSTEAPDCDGDMVPDFEQILAEPSLDCDGNDNLDVCDFDCDANGTPDACDIAADPNADCNGNGTVDSCDIAEGNALDCNENGTPDSCDLVAGDPDCNNNGIPDGCDLAMGEVVDCDENGTSDLCEIMADPSKDCNGNLLLDICGEIDCNANSTPDDCEYPACPGTMPGDMTCDGSVTQADLPAFVDYLLSGIVSCQADINGDGAVNAHDIPPFIALLLAGD